MPSRGLDVSPRHSPSIREILQNTPLMYAAQYCGPKVIGVLVDAGAKVDVRNGSGISPLAMALIMSNFDAAEALVARGAELAKNDQTMVSRVSEPRGKAIIQTAKRWRASAARRAEASERRSLGRTVHSAPGSTVARHHPLRQPGGDTSTARSRPVE